jgi:hypothetical protein
MRLSSWGRGAEALRPLPPLGIQRGADPIAPVGWPLCDARCDGGTGFPSRFSPDIATPRLKSRRTGQSRVASDLACIVRAVPTLWVRRCQRCRKDDFRKVWDDESAAYADTSLDDRPRWDLDRESGWICPSCGRRGNTVEPQQRPRM